MERQEEFMKSTSKLKEELKTKEEDMAHVVGTPDASPDKKGKKESQRLAALVNSKD